MTKKETEKKELIVIGAGPGGYAAAFRAADLGIKVTLIDPEVNPGGVCLYRGCIPSKALLHLTKIKEDAEQVEEHGIVFDSPKIDLEKINSFKDNVVKKLTDGLGQLSKGHKIEYIQGRAVFLSESKVEVTTNEGETTKYSFKNTIIATGSFPISLPGVKIDHEIILDSTSALDLKEIPKSMLVIGGGYIGLELGSVYANLGCEVSVAEMTAGFLPGADRDLVKVFEKSNKDLFQETHFNTKVEEIHSDGKKALVVLKNKDGKQTETYDKVLIAIGRKPQSGKIQLEKAGIKIDKKGFIPVNARRQTATKGIYAIGDLTGEPMLAHKASHEGRVAAEVIAGEKGAAYDVQAVPGIVFTNPEMAWCGLTEREAKEKGLKVAVKKFPWSASGRAIALGKPTGLTKLIFNPDNGIILGAGVAGVNAGSLIPELTLAIEMGATAEDISLTVHPHPTLSETIMESAELFLGSPTHISKK